MYLCESFNSYYKEVDNYACNFNGSFRERSSRKYSNDLLSSFHLIFPYMLLILLEIYIFFHGVRIVLIE